MPPGCAQGALKNFKIPEVRPFKILSSRLKIWSHASKSQKTVSNPGFWAENPILEDSLRIRDPTFQVRHFTPRCEKISEQIRTPQFAVEVAIVHWSQNTTQHARPARAIERQISTRARKNLFYLSFLNVREARPPSSGRPGRARARARALSTKQNFKITTFLLVNFITDHGESCSVSRDWQPPKISARSVPVEKSYDQNKFFYLQTWPVTWSSIPGILKELKDRVLRRLIRPSTKIATQTWYASFLTFNTIGSLLYRKHFWWKRKFYLGQKRHEHSQNFELFLQFPRSQRHPVCTLSHLVNLNIMIFLCSGKSLDVRRLDVRRRCKT